MLRVQAGVYGAYGAYGTAGAQSGKPTVCYELQPLVLVTDFVVTVLCYRHARPHTIFLLLCRARLQETTLLMLWACVISVEDCTVGMPILSGFWWYVTLFRCPISEAWPCDRNR